MWEQIKHIFVESFGRVAASAAAVVPVVLAMVVVVAASLLLAWVVGVLLRRFLGGVGLDRRVRQWGLSGATPWVPGGSPSRLVVRVTFWLVLVAGIAVGLNALSAGATGAFALRLLAYMPRVVVAAVIFVVGLGAARLLERNVLISAVNMHIQSARLLSLGVKWLVTVLATAMALEQLGIGGAIVTIFFAILFGGIVLALSLAVGLGSRDLVSRSLEKHMDADKDAPPHDTIGHL